MSLTLWIVLGVFALLILWLFGKSARRHFVLSLMRQAIYLIPRYFV